LSFSLVEIHPAALEEAQAAAEWYRQQRSGCGDGLGGKRGRHFSERRILGAILRGS